MSAALALQLLRDSRHEDDKEMLPLIAAAHSQLIAENYCDEMLSDAIAQGLASEKQEKQHRKCLAPIARGTVLFAEGGAGGPASVAALTWPARRMARASAHACSPLNQEGSPPLGAAAAPRGVCALAPPCSSAEGASPRSQLPPPPRPGAAG